MFNDLRLSGFFCLALVSIAACGGGDGQDPTIVNNPPVSTELATIDADTATTVAGIAARQVLEENLISTLTTTGIPVLAAGSGATQEMLRLSGSPLPPGLGAVQATLAPCEVSGTVDLDYTVADSETVTVNDTFSIVFDACDNGDGSVASGGITMTVSGIDGDPTTEQFLLNLVIDLNALSVTTGGETTGASGSLEIGIDTRQTSVTTLTLSASTLTVSSGGITETLSNLSITVIEDQSMFPASVSVETGFTLSTPKLDGDITVSTTIALQRSGDEYPYEGEFEVSGDGDATVRLIALGPNSVRLEVDLDGDGATDVTIDTTWTEILAQAEAA